MASWEGSFSLAFWFTEASGLGLAFSEALSLLEYVELEDMFGRK